MIRGTWPAVTASVETFVRTGVLGPVALGVRRSELQRVIGPPTDWAAKRPCPISPIWVYGNVEIHFDDDQVSLIQFDTGFGIPRGGSGLDLRPWLLRSWMSLADLETGLSAAAIDFRVGPDRWNPDCVSVTTVGNVGFLLQAGDDEARTGLDSFGVSK